MQRKNTIQTNKQRNMNIKEKKKKCKEIKKSMIVHTTSRLGLLINKVYSIGNSCHLTYKS